MHNFVIEEPAGDSIGEMDQFGYFRKLWEKIQNQTRWKQVCKIN